MWRRKAWAVVRREFGTRVRTRWFIISTVVAPVFLFVTLVIPIGFGDGGAGPVRVVVLDDGDAAAAAVVEQQLLATGRWYARPLRGGDQLADSLAQAVQARQLDGFVIVTGRSVEGVTAEYRGHNVGSNADMKELGLALSRALLSERARRAGVEQAVVNAIRQGADIVMVPLEDDSRRPSGGATIAVAYLVVFLLYISLLVYGQGVMRSVIEEKSTRMAEVLASSMPPEALMAGKVIGVGAVGLFQLTIWVTSGIVLYQLKSGGVSDEASAAAIFQGLTATSVIVLGLFFVLGFFLFSALYAMVGAVVTTEQEAQHAQIPVTFLLVPGLLLFPAMVGDPAGRLGVVMGLIPFSSPVIMPVRWVMGAASAIQLLVSTLILALTAGTFVMIAARVYRVGILMYGKRATLSEVIRWIGSP